MRKHSRHNYLLAGCLLFAALNCTVLHSGTHNTVYHTLTDVTYEKKKPSKKYSCIQQRHHHKLLSQRESAWCM